MSGEDIRKLLGGYATGTLSADEQKALFEAALHDEKLFAALADEHALREMLDNPGNRAAILRALEPSRTWVWRWMVPVGALAGLVVIASVVFVFNRPAPQPAVQMAKVVQPALQPEIARELPPPSPTTPARAAAVKEPTAAGPAAARERRQVMDRVAPSPAVRDTREEPRPAALAAPAAPPAVEELRSAKKESVDVRGYASGGAQTNAGKLQYTILKRGADGQFKPVDPSAPLQPADAVRLNVEADEAGFLSVSQKEPSKVLFQGAVQKQVPVTIPATGSLDLSIRGALQIMFTQPNVAGSLQNALLPGAPQAKSKAVSQTTAEKAVSKDQSQGVITLDVNLNMATPSQQQK